MRSFLIWALHQRILRWSNQGGRYGRDEKCIQNFSR